MTSKYYSGHFLIYANAARKCLCLLKDVCMKRGKKNLSKWLSSTIKKKHGVQKRNCTLSRAVAKKVYNVFREGTEYTNCNVDPNSI